MTKLRRLLRSVMGRGYDAPMLTKQLITPRCSDLWRVAVTAAMLAVTAIVGAAAFVQWMAQSTQASRLEAPAVRGMVLSPGESITLVDTLSGNWSVQAPSTSGARGPTWSTGADTTTINLCDGSAHLVGNDVAGYVTDAFGVWQSCGVVFKIAYAESEVPTCSVIGLGDVRIKKVFVGTTGISVVRERALDEVDPPRGGFAYECYVE